MFIGGLPTQVLEQFKGLLAGLPTNLVYVCCSGSFRSERVVFLHNKWSAIISNDVSFYSCALGAWLAGEPLAYRLTGELEPLEELLAEDDDPARRAAGAILAQEIAQWAGGSANPHKAAHLLPVQVAKLKAAFGDLELAGFRPQDWLAHVDQGIGEGATIVAFPPFFKGDYEHMYRWLHAHVEWAAPEYPLYDPKHLVEVADRLRDSGRPYVFISDRVLEGHEPIGRADFPNKVPHWLYASAGEASVVRVRQALKPFAYKPIDPEKLRPDSKITIVPAPGAEAFYIRQIFVKKSIKLSPARHNFFVYLDDMLAGVIGYENVDTNRAKVKRHDQMYLLSDLSTTRELRLSKLIVRLSLNATVLRTLSARRLEPVRYITTTAFSEQPVSMKYRGVYEVLSRRPAPEHMGGWQLQYGGELIDESLEDAFTWWWTGHAHPRARDLGSARNRGRGQRPPGPKGPGGQRPVHDPSPAGATRG